MESKIQSLLRSYGFLYTNKAWRRCTCAGSFRIKIGQEMILLAYIRPDSSSYHNRYLALKTDEDVDKVRRILSTLHSYKVFETIRSVCYIDWSKRKHD